MSGRDASSDEMPGFSFSGLLGRERDDLALDMILDGRSLPPDASRDMHDLAQMLACLAEPAGPGSLAGEAVARSAFTRAVTPAGISSVPPPADAVRTAPRRDGQPAGHRRSAPRRARLAGVLAAVATVLATATAAAYADMLPGPVQDLAHTVIGAPAATPAHPNHPGGHQTSSGHHRAHPAHPAHPASRSSGKATGHAKPGHPSHPAKPAHPARSSHRAHPARPAHPTQAGHQVPG